MKRLFMFFLACGLVVCFTGSVRATPTLWSGHWYEAVYVESGISWFDADALATAQGGYLASVKDAAENSYLFSLVSDNKFWALVGNYNTWGPWLGGYYDGTNWKWVSGDPWSFEKWDPSEPSGDSNEDRIHFYGGSNHGTLSKEETWNNLNSGNYLGNGVGYVKGYIIEWDYDPSNPPSNNTVPIPGAIWLMGSGLLGLVGWRRFR